MPDDEIQTMEEQISYLLSQVTQLKNQSLALRFTAAYATMNGGQTTTLSAAIGYSDTAITVASAIDIANSSYMLIDDEIVQVISGGGTTSLTILRGQIMTVPAAHASGAIVDNTLYPITVPAGLNRIPRMVSVNSSFASGTTILGTCSGSYAVPSMRNSFTPKSYFEYSILQSGSGVYPPASPFTTLSATITATQTTISVASGSNIVNGQYIQIVGSTVEVMKVMSGANTTSLTVLRGQNGTTASAYSSGTGVCNAFCGYVVYFMIGQNGYRATVKADTQYVYILGQQVGSGIAGQMNMMINIFA